MADGERQYWQPHNLQNSRSITSVSEKDSNKYDVFVSHSSSDSEASLQLTRILESIGLKCYHYERDTTPGQNLVPTFCNAIEKSQHTVAIVTRNMQQSQWVEFEVRNARIKAQRENKNVFIPVLLGIEPSDIPCYLKEHKYIEASSPSFWDDLVYQLTNDITLDEALVVGNLAHGLAWSHYYGYLAIVLPFLKKGMEDSMYAKEGHRVLHKMVMVFPKSCRCYAKFSELDGNIQAVDGKIKIEGARAGKPRTYNSPIHRITDPDTGYEYYCVLEFPAVLMTMYEMEMGRVAKLDEDEKYHQMNMFIEKIRDILNLSPECQNTSVLVDYDDTCVGPESQQPNKLSRRIIEMAVQKDMEAEAARNNMEENAMCEPLNKLTL